MNIAIYGAQALALGAYHSIKKLFPEQEILCFVVTEMGSNASSLCGISVKELTKFSDEYAEEEKKNMQILIATPENVMDEIERMLEKYGFCHYVRLDSQRWAQMQKYACIKQDVFTPLELYPIGFTRSKIHIYKAKFYKDKKLQTKLSEPDYVTPLQVGAWQTDVRVADITDCEGDHISRKNGNYSELTGLYWIWKNRVRNRYYGENCYYGLAHYRRFLDLSEDDLLRLNDNGIDVVLPYPMPYEPNMEEHHKRYLSAGEWSAVLQALEELQPEYAGVFQEILEQEYFFNYNIILARDEIFDTYCSWLFPVLSRVEEICDPDGKKKPNRYIGYIGETLETLYFLYNRKKLNIAHAGCRFLL